MRRELPLFAEAQRCLDAYAATKDSSKKEKAVERFEEIGREIARRVQVPELPIKLKDIAVQDGCIYITAEKTSLVEYAHQHPPRCIRALAPVPLMELVAGMSAYKFLAYFRVGCPCGERNTYVLGYFWEGEGPVPAKIFVSPLALECPTCGRVSELIDTRQHGYLGEQGGDCNKTGEGPRTRFPCPQCGVVPLAVFPAFSYQGHDYDPFDLAARPQDFFGWFSLYGQCSRCGRLIVIADFESA